MPREISYKRQMGDKLIAWKLVLDDDDIMVSHEPDSEVARQARQTSVRLPGSVDTGRIQATREFYRRFLKLDEPCWFPECQDLRDQMEAELSAPDCKACSHTRIRTQYAAKAYQSFNSNTPSE